MKRYLKILTSIVGALLLCIMTELCFQMKLLTLDKKQKGIHEMEFSDGETFSFDVNMYVDRLSIEFDSKGTYMQRLIVEYSNMYGKAEKMIIEDANPIYIRDSIVNIRKNVNKITIEKHDNDNPAIINKITVKNTNVINWIRVAFFFLGYISIALIVVLRDIIANKIQVGFAIVAGCVGLSMVLAMPLVRVGFDEEVHFRNAFVLSFESNTTQNDTLWDMLNTEDENHPGFRSGSYEEYKAFYRYLNKNALYKDNGLEPFRNTHRTTSGIATFSYIFIAIAINIARLFKMNFANIYILARLINLIVYVTTMYFAIRNIKKGKMLIATIGLMPTVMFLSSTVSYDPIVIAFITLGLSYILNEFTTDEEISTKNFILGCVFLGYGCLAKAVYAPLFLIGMLYPATKFKNKNTKIVMKSGYFLGFIILMILTVLPLMLGHEGGDTRGGDTSDIGQLGYMTSNLFGYIGLLFKSIGTHLFSYTLGKDIWDNMYFFGMGKFIILLSIILVVVVLTQGEDNFLFKKRNKIFIGLIIFSIIALIWTSMYMAFTGKGVASVINGVQGRYYIPVMFLLLSLFATDKIKCEWNPKITRNVLFTILSLVLSFETYTQIITNSCI